MQTFNVSVDLSAFNLGPVIAASGVFESLSAAVERVAMTGAERWREEVGRARLWQGERDAYAESIHVNRMGPYEAEIVSDYKFVEDIETGRPPYDLKRMLSTSSKVRRTKDGRRFLVIPFRHNTPGNNALASAMPQEVYNIARTLKVSSVTSMGERRSGERTSLSPTKGMHAFSWQDPFMSDPQTRKHFMVAKSNYKWGDRITRHMLRDAGVDKAGQKRYAGMYNMKGQNGATGGMITFRIMMEGKPGWIIPARAGLHLAQHVSEGLLADAEKVFAGALNKDLDRAKAG